ncbi:AAA family ATPase [Actinoplanes sp. NPDC049118]|uniref:MinD/ParA family ATP-binding protein n=1 Tax=Actinoplanes sp. NPDC049118 TaxID=3155769 RepID=UPI0033E13A03
MDGTETGWGRPAEPAPRWRALLDRARHGSRAAEEHSDAEGTEAEARRQGPPSPRPSGRPFNPLDPRQSEQARGGHEQRQPPVPERRPVNPLDRRPGRASLGERLGQSEPLGPPPEPRQPEPRQPDSRPLNPLAESRRQSRIGEGFQPRPAAGEEPHSFFNPARNAVPPSIGRVSPDPAPPISRGAASVVSASVLPPPALAPRLPATTAPAPTSPAPARIEWRQARPEQEDRAVATLRRKLGKPRVMAFANPKGGVHKTTATVLAAATIGSVRGRGVLAWDDNELRGTLGLRAGSARHARTIRHLVGELLEIENLHGEGLMSHLDDFLRHASDGSYDVLAGEENPRFAQRLDQSTVRRVMDLLRRTHDVICVDTGNNVESVNWQTVMRSADQLVVTTVPREDAAFTADWMLDVLNETGMEDLVSNAVTLISCPSPGKLPLLDDLAKHFATRTRAVAVVPYDPALEVGSSIEYSVLQPETRQAWMRAAAAMIEPFAE